MGGKMTFSNLKGRNYHFIKPWVGNSDLYDLKKYMIYSLV